MCFCPGASGKALPSRATSAAGSSIASRRSSSRRAARTAYTRTVNLFLRWATKEGDVATGVKAQQPKAPKRLVDILSRDEIEQLEDAARNERDKLIVRVLGDAGLRLGELIALRTEDLKERVRGEYYLHSRQGTARSPRAR